MCKYCEYDSDGELAIFEDKDAETRAYLDEYDRMGWTLTISENGHVAEVGVSHCPWCGEELL